MKRVEDLQKCFDTLSEHPNDEWGVTSLGVSVCTKRNTSRTSGLCTYTTFFVGAPIKTVLLCIPIAVAKPSNLSNSGDEN